MEVTVVDIRGLDKLALLRALWERQTARCESAESGPFDVSTAALAVVGGYIDALQGRPIRMSLAGAAVHPVQYDAAGSSPGRCARVIKRLRTASPARMRRSRATGFYCVRSMAAGRQFTPLTEAEPDDQSLCVHCELTRDLHVQQRHAEVLTPIAARDGNMTKPVLY
jgi:hypothetical protein